MTIADTTVRVAAQSNETVWFPVRAVHPISGAINPTSYLIHIAIVPEGTSPSVWKAAAWEPTPVSLPDPNDSYRLKDWYLGKIELGIPSTFELTPDRYVAYVRVTSGTDAPVVSVCNVEVY